MPVVRDELVMVGSRCYMKATVRFTNCESGGTMGNISYVREELDERDMDISQIIGSNNDYVRRHALNGLSCINDMKDIGTVQEGVPGEEDKRSGEEEQPRKLNESQVNDLIAERRRMGKH